MISWFSIRKNVRAMRLPREDRISQSPAPSESTSGFPTGQAHCTARISEPICFRFSTGRLFSHSLTGSLPDSVAKNRVASGRGAEAISLFVSKMMRVSKSECHTPAHLPRSRSRNGFRWLLACHVTPPSNFFKNPPFPPSAIRFFPPLVCLACPRAAVNPAVLKKTTNHAKKSYFSLHEIDHAITK